MSKGLLFVVSGFSGAGKGTLMKLLLKRNPGYALSVSATTRSPRSGEREGVEYFFKTEDEFRAMIENDELLEYENYVGHFYGTPRKYVEEMIEGGRDVILEIDVRGGLNIKKKWPQAVLIFVSAPSVAELERRLKERDSESEEDIKNRLDQLAREYSSVSSYDYILVNDDIEEGIRSFDAIVRAERQRVANSAEFIKRLGSEISGGEK